MKKLLLYFGCLLSGTYYCHADQPIVNMMPRWDGGYGFQVVDEFIQRDKLFDGKREIGSGLAEKIHKVSLEAVYTWDKSIRLTVKIPYIIQAEREILDINGNKVEQESSGLGDIKLALPLKKYFNEDGYSGNWSLTPELTLPTGSGADDYSIPDQEWALGLGFGYEVESHRYFFAAGASLRHVFSDDKPFEVSAHIDLGVNFSDRGQFLIETDYRFEDDGTRYFKSGPALYWRFSDTVHSRIEWKQSFAETRGVIDHGDSMFLKATLGWVF